MGYSHTLKDKANNYNKNSNNIIDNTDDNSHDIISIFIFLNDAKIPKPSGMNTPPTAYSAWCICWPSRMSSSSR